MRMKTFIVCASVASSLAVAWPAYADLSSIGLLLPAKQASMTHKAQQALSPDAQQRLLNCRRWRTSCYRRFSPYSVGLRHCVQGLKRQGC